MGLNVAQKLIQSHLVEIGIRTDQTLTQDATGTLAMLELEGIGLDRAWTELSTQYVDHNLIQEDYKNADDHLFLYSACRRFGIWYSPAGNAVSHPVHQERFGKPGKTLLGSDSHTPAAGAIGMLAIGAGGLEGGAGHSGGTLPSKNAGSLGGRTRWPAAGLGKRIDLQSDEDTRYDIYETIDLSTLEPPIAMPSSPGNVVPVREAAGREIYQAYIGSSANPRVSLLRCRGRNRSREEEVRTTGPLQVNG